MAKIEPINLLAEITRKDNPIQKISAGLMVIEKKKGPLMTDYLLSQRMAEELALEAWAYKEFYEAAWHLAKMVDRSTAGEYIAPFVMEQAKDNYITAKNHCQALQANKPNTQDTKVRRE